jgi:hypothetical protein
MTIYIDSAGKATNVHLAASTPVSETWMPTSSSTPGSAGAPLWRSPGRAAAWTNSFPAEPERFFIG